MEQSVLVEGYLEVMLDIMGTSPVSWAACDGRRSTSVRGGHKNKFVRYT